MSNNQRIITTVILSLILLIGGVISSSKSLKAVVYEPDPPITLEPEIFFQQDGITFSKLAIDSTYVLGLSKDAGLYILDLDLNLVGTFNSVSPINPNRPIEYKDVEIDGDVVYIGTYPYGLVSVSISDPVNPTQLDVLPIQGIIGDVEISGNVAYVAADAYGLYSVNIANPSSMVILDNRPIRQARGISLGGDYAMVFDERGWVSTIREGSLIDISNPSNLEKVGETPKEINGGIFKGNLFYAIGGLGGKTFYTFNLTDPSNPVQIRALALISLGQAEPKDVILTNNRFYYSLTNEFAVANFTDSPIMFHKFNSSLAVGEEDFFDIDQSNTAIYIAEGSYGIFKFEFSSIENAMPKPTVNTSESSRSRKTETVIQSEFIILSFFVTLIILFYRNKNITK